MEFEKTSHLSALLEALENDSISDVQTTVDALHPAEIALLLESLPWRERAVVWGLIDDDNHGEILVELNDEVRSKLIEDMDAEEVVAAAEGMELDDLADLVADLIESEVVVGRRINYRIWDSWPLLTALLACIFSEWVLRRRSGLA